MDPSSSQANQKIVDDDDEILVPKKIQDLIERGIRTLSNSLSTVKSNINEIKSTAAQEQEEEMQTGIKIKVLNKMLEQEQNKMAESQLLEMKELKERWYTRMELKNLQELQPSSQGVSAILGGLPPQQHLLSPSPIVKASSAIVTEHLNETPNISSSNPSSQSIIGTSYNVTRVKYQVKQSNHSQSLHEDDKSSSQLLAGTSAAPTTTSAHQ